MITHFTSLGHGTAKNNLLTTPGNRPQIHNIEPQTLANSFFRFDPTCKFHQHPAKQSCESRTRIYTHTKKEGMHCVADAAPKRQARKVRPKFLTLRTEGAKADRTPGRKYKTPPTHKRENHFTTPRYKSISSRLLLPLSLRSGIQSKADFEEGIVTQITKIFRKCQCPEQIHVTTREENLQEKL